MNVDAPVQAPPIDATPVARCRTDPARASFELLRTREKAPPVHAAAFILSACAGCTNAAAMLGALSDHSIGVSHVTGSATKVGLGLKG